MSAKQSLQAFQCSSTDKVAHIPTLNDPKTGERIILWRDIKSAFEDAKTIWNGTSLVPFLTDENTLELYIPWRIACYPDDVLEVIMEGAGQVGHTRETSTLIETPLVGGGSKDHDSSRYFQSSTGTADVASLTTTVETLEIADTNTLNHSLLGYSLGMPQDTQLSQTTVAIMQSPGQIQADMHKNMEFQERMIQMQTMMDEKLTKLDEKQDNMLRMQQQALDRLVIIQNSVQALITQTYELHEYPIPRLFIVLPKAVGLSGKLKGILSEQFRLYFLCECGTHTMTEDTKTPHHIHLAKHDGYDLEKPSVFFERYGKYVLTLMHMIKYGITAAGVIVPPLASSGIVDGLDTAQKHMEDLKKNIGSLVDDAIKFLDDIKTNNGMDDELAARHTEFDQLEALEGADLRQLESYLKVKDQGRVLGNLYRIVTSEGHVKWVCFDHYRTNYRETTIKYLREVVGVNRGKYIEEMGRIEITISSNTLAKQFYDAMIKARGIQELEITLEWDATMDDLRTLANAVTKANVICLTVDGTHLKSPTLDLVNRSRRYDPIMQLVSNTRIQSLQLKAFGDFFARVSKSSLVPAPKLRVLSIPSELPLEDKAKSLGSLLEYYSSLTTLELKLHQQVPITKATSDILNKLLKLESLKIDHGKLIVAAGISNSMDEAKDQLSGILPQHISVFSQLRIRQQGGRCLAISATKGLKLHELMEMDILDIPGNLESFSIEYGELSVTAGISQGKIKDVDLTIVQLDDLYSDGLRFIQKNCLARLAIRYTPQAADEEQLVDILRHSTFLSHLQIGCEGGRALAIVSIVVSTRERIVQERGSCNLRTFELMEENLVSFNVRARWDTQKTHIRSHLEFSEDSNSFDMRTWIRLKDMMSIEDDDPVYDFIRQYGWSIVFFNEESTKNDTFAAILDDIPNTRTTLLENLWIRPKGEPASGLDRLGKIIERSPNFKDFGLYVNLDKDDQFKMTQALLSQHGTILSRLWLYCDLNEPISWIASTFPTKSSFPTLVSLEIWPKNGYKPPPSLLSWIMAMVSAPPRELESHSPTRSLPPNVVNSRSTHDESKSTGAWTPLSKIMLRFVEAQAEEWKALIEVIDFSTLEDLDFGYSNFSQEQFQLLMDRHNLSKVPLRSLIITGTNLVVETDSEALEAMLAELRKEAPSVNITK